MLISSVLYNIIIIFTIYQHKTPDIHSVQKKRDHNVFVIISGGTCFPARWCELVVGRSLIEMYAVWVDHFSYPTRNPSR